MNLPAMNPAAMDDTAMPLPVIDEAPIDDLTSTDLAIADADGAAAAAESIPAAALRPQAAAAPRRPEATANTTVQSRRSGSEPGADPAAASGRRQRIGLRLHCRGVVQGVGFRPAVARLAERLGLVGGLANVRGAVRIELAGPHPALQRFIAELPANLPAGARLEPLQPEWLAAPLPAALAAGRGLRIAAAPPQPLGVGLVAPSLVADRAPCPDCLRELRDPADRRHGYAFISCCSCGPRYAIASAEPFCRAHTTLAGFPLCPACQAEFDDPGDRRFHAETIGCPACGPRLRLLDGRGRLLAGSSEGASQSLEPPIAAGGRTELRRESAAVGTVATRSPVEPCSAADPPGKAEALSKGEPLGGAGPPSKVDAPLKARPLSKPQPPGKAVALSNKVRSREAADALSEAVALLRCGGVLALQGVGGFQLLVDATAAAAVARLRQRKQRPDKPFALLVDSPERLQDLVHPSPQELLALHDPAAPIVLLASPAAVHCSVLAGVAPGAPALGVMLPASPLHQLLAEAFAGPLVATSGNRSGEPLCTDPAEALERLAGIADAFLVHDRPIARPLDDSVLQLIDGRPALLRRARGYAPEALPLRLAERQGLSSASCPSAEVCRCQPTSPSPAAEAWGGAWPGPGPAPAHRRLSSPGSGGPASLVEPFESLAPVQAVTAGEAVAVAEAVAAVETVETGGAAWACQDAEAVAAAGSTQAVAGAGAPEALGIAGAAAAPTAAQAAGAAGTDLDRPAVLLALGSDLKSAPALAVADRLWLAPHLGDLADSRCLERWRAGILELLERQPPGARLSMAVDAHPAYLSTQLAEALLAMPTPPPGPDRGEHCPRKPDPRNPGLLEVGPLQPQLLETELGQQHPGQLKLDQQNPDPLKPRSLEADLLQPDLLQSDLRHTRLPEAGLLERGRPGVAAGPGMARHPGLIPPVPRLVPQLVAHHRAHGLAVAAEHGLALPLPALVLDGLGYGGGAVPLWGCELLWLQTDGCRRLASLRPFPLPGGERAVREPRRSALGLLWAAGLIDHPGAEAVRAGFEAGDLAVLIQALRSDCNSPWCSSAGRLFDAVAALLDLVQVASHDAHAGLLLQAAASQAPAVPGAYPLPWCGPNACWAAEAATASETPAGQGEPPTLPRLDWQPLITTLLHDIAAGCSQELCAARFHTGLVEGWAQAIASLCLPASGDATAATDLSGLASPSCDQGETAGPAVILAGGCFQNRLLLEGLIAALRQRGLRPFWGERIPLNDGGLAAGQILALQQATRHASASTAQWA